MTERRPRFLALFGQMQKSLLHKDVGEIPARMAEHAGWRAELAFCRVPSEPRLGAAHRQAELADLGVPRSRADKLRRLAQHVARRARSTDAMLVYHMSPESMVLSMLYKQLNPRGVAILKLDADERFLGQIEERRGTWKLKVNSQLLRAAPFDFVTVETRRMADAVTPMMAAHRKRVVFLPNGFTAGVAVDIDDVLRRKENIVLTAGRLGFPQKHNELLVDAIAALPRETLEGWRVVLAGDVLPPLERHIDATLERRRDLRDVIQRVGRIDDRDRLYDLYRRARVFCLTSRWESYGLVLPEAMYFGCYVVSTDVGAARDLSRDGQLASLVPIGDHAALADALGRVMRGDVDVHRAAKLAHEDVATGHTWKNVVAMLDGYIAGARGRGARGPVAPRRTPDHSSAPR